MAVEALRICLNGHIPEYDGGGPRERTPFCSECGDPVVTECQSCHRPLPEPDEFDPPKVPAYCGHCGKAHIWTQRKIEAAIEMFVEDVGVTSEDKAALKSEIQHISRDTARAELAATRISALLNKVKAETAKAVRDILVGLASSIIAGKLGGK